MRVFQILGASILLSACDSATEPGVPTHIKALSATSLTGTVGSEVTPAPSVRVTDQRNNPIQGVEVVFFKSDDGGMITSTSTRTDGNGTATVGTWRLGTKAGNQELRAVLAIPPVPPPHGVLFTAAASPAHPATVTALDSAPVAPAGSTLSLRVRVTDAFNNPIATEAVFFEVESGTGIVSPTLSHTNREGIAVADWRLGVSGENSVTARVTGLQAARFSATVLQTPVYYDLATMDGYTSFPKGWIALGDDSRFTTLVNGIAGGGLYAISGPAIVFTYSSADFLSRLGETADWWAYPYSTQSESGSYAPEVIVLRRCLGEDCYEDNWTFRRRVP